MRIHWDNKKKQKLAELIDNNANTEEAMKFFGTSYSAISIATRRIGGFIRGGKLYWNPDRVAPKITIKTTLKDRVKTVLSEIESLQKEGATFTMRDNKLVAMIDINSL